MFLSTDKQSCYLHFWSTGCEGDPNWIGDGYCDDINNNEVCDFDGGDCCGSNVFTAYCTECMCCDSVGCIASVCYSNEDCSGNGYCQKGHCICLPNYNYLKDCSHYGCKHYIIFIFLICSVKYKSGI